MQNTVVAGPRGRQFSNNQIDVDSKEAVYLDPKPSDECKTKQHQDQMMLGGTSHVA